VRTSPDVLTGQFARRYVIEHEIGRGATATVYRARDTERGQLVAIKILRRELGETSAARLFLREMRSTAALQHPHIVGVIDEGEYDDRLYIVLPYLDGGTLRDQLNREKQLAIPDAVSITATIADALDHAHQHGLIHRDVKPENILFTGGQPCLADFGIARAFEKALGDTSTTSGIVRGTPAYMSPEQASGDRDLDGRSDLFSLGCVLYEMLAGVPAFVGATIGSVIAQRFVHAPRDVRVFRSTVSPALSAVIAKSLALERADRFRTAGDMARALREASTDSESFAGPQPHHGRRGWRGQRTRRVLLAVTALVAAATIVSASILERQASGASRFRERDWILVADFDGPRDDPQLATAVRELATTELNQSRFVSTLPRSQLNATMRLAGLPDTTMVGPQLAHELAVRSAVRAVLVGGITRLGVGNYSIVLHVIDADNGADIVSAAGAAHDSTLVSTVQRLARDVRSGLGERRSSIESTLPLYQVATPSFAAYREYVEGARLQSRGDGRGSNKVLRAAIALDSGFASAWVTTGWNYLNDRALDSARWAFGHAKQLDTRLSDLQRYRLDADIAYTLNYDLPTAIRAYDLYLDRAPRSWTGHNNRGLYLLALGRYEDALASFERAVAVHPFGPKGAQIQVMNKAATQICLGRLVEARQTMRDLSGPFATHLRLIFDAATDAWGDADSISGAAATSPSSPGWLRVQATATAASGKASRGAVRAADEVFARAAAGATPDVKRWYYRARLLLAVTSGHSVPSLPNDIAADTTVAARATVALGEAIANDTARARAALAPVISASSDDLRRLGNGPRLAEAWLDARGARWAAATDDIALAATVGEHDSALLDRAGSLSMRWLAADAYAQRGRVDSAAALLELAIKPERITGQEYALRGLVVSFAHRRLAQWYMTLGKRNEAVTHWRAFLDAFTEPDQDLASLVAEARRALAQLKAA
jgi:serine/threonine-protein kinase